MAKSSRQGILPGMDPQAGPDDHPAASAVAPRAKRRAPKKPQNAARPLDEPPVDRVASPTQYACDVAGEGPRAGEPACLEGATVWIVDANALIFQVFHALPEMTSPQGEPVNAVFGFSRDMLYLLEEKKPDYLFVAFDGPERTFRHELYEDYKANRDEMPSDLVPQYEPIERLLAALNVPVLAYDAYEADDLLATVAHRVSELGGECYIVSPDKDCRQLISDRVKVYNVRKNVIYDAAALKEDWQIRPDQVVDFQALVGDSVDNVPGVPLIGPKVAGEYLQKFDTLDQLLARVGELPKGKRKDNLIAMREQALLSRELVRLDRNVPVAVDWDAARVRGVNREALVELFSELGFRGLKAKFATLPERVPDEAWQADYQLIATPERLRWLVDEMSKQEAISFDTETTSIWPRWAEIVGYSFAWRPGEAWYVPVMAPPGEPCLDPQATLAALRPVLESPRIKKVGQNLKYDMIVLRSAGVEVAGAHFDTMVASYLLHAGERNHNLDELSLRYLKHQTIKIDELIGSGKNQKRMDEVPLDQITDYAAEDADVALRLSAPLAAGLKESQLDSLFHEVEVPLVEVLVEIESNGIKIDVQRLAELSAKYGRRVAELEKEIHELAGREFNIGSPKQLQQILFDEQKLPMVKKIRSGGSTDADVLEELARLHPLPAKIIEYRQFAKLKNTYVDALPQLVHPTTGRVHASFNQVVAATGRLSAHDPNLQNIPVRTESGREIRAAFLPGHEGWKLLAADYSQIELRVLAHFSGDRTLCEAFARDEDIHARVAGEVYNVPIEQVTSAMRRSAKAVNFGVIYGQSAFGLARALNIEQEEAARFINAYFDRYPGVEQFLQRILEECQKSGYVSTILGRRRAIRGIRHGAGRQRNLPERTAINTVIQGSAADLIKLAMIRIHHRLRREQLAARMLLQIHDELVFETPPHEHDRLAQLVREEMAGVMPLSVPLNVDLKSGDNWADCQEWN